MTIAAFEAVLSSPRARRELWGWAMLAVASIAIAGVYAVLMIVSRAPGSEDRVPWLLGFFNKGLVIHVVFSFVVWFLAVMGALFQLAAYRAGRGTPRLEGLGMAGLWLSVVACPLLFVPAFMASADASLNNYVPMLLHPLYYLGLAALGGGVALAAVRLIVTARTAPDRPDTVTLGAVRAAVVYLLSILCVLIAWWLQRDEAASPGFFEDMFWGGGHALQFANAILLAGAWYMLGSLAQGQPLASERAHNTATLLLLLFALLAPLIYVVFAPFSGEQRQAFTDLQYGLGPSTFLMAVALMAGLALRRGGVAWSSSALQCLFLSVAIFGLGGVFGFFVDGTDTRTPSHYHGVIGGITLAYMGLFYALILPLLGRAPTWRKTIKVQIWLYAVGQALQCVGLFMAGAPRKTAGAAQGLETAAELLGMRLNYSGGGLAILGGVLFVVIAGTALLRKPRIDQG